MNITIPYGSLTKFIPRLTKKMSPVMWITLSSILLAIAASTYAYMHDYIVVYGDAESHLNIAKRVIHSITPGAAQLGGIWLPIPHLMLVPFVAVDFLWRTGLAGSIVSGTCFVISAVFLYKTTFQITKSQLASVVAFLVFSLNPNILYLQSTPMTELSLIMFFILSTYYYILFVEHKEKTIYLILAAFFGFCATLSRYDGWFLVLFEAMGIMAIYLPSRKKWREMEGKLFLFATLAFFGIAFWMLWDYLILGDPFYFTNSQFSAKSQQQNWLSRGELPAYHNLPVSILYYFVNSASSSGILLFFAALFGAYSFLRSKFTIERIVIMVILLVTFTFNVVTLYLGQSVIFIPHLTPRSFEWTLFNVRYGAMMVPTVAFFIGYLFHKRTIVGRGILITLLVIQLGLFAVHFSPVLALADGTEGLSKAKRPDAEQWIKNHYDFGLVLIDDYARTVSIVRSGIPMQNIIYIGNRIYWEESFYEPEKYARWIIMQRDDDVWKGIYDKPQLQGRLFKYFKKVYTSPDILIFQRNNVR